MLFMKTLAEALYNVIVIYGVFAVLALLTFIVLPLLIVIVAAAFFAAFVCWACGMPITVKVNDEQVGTVRWFKFTRL
jgi:hypothetical protein